MSAIREAAPIAVANGLAVMALVYLNGGSTNMLVSAGAAIIAGSAGGVLVAKELRKRGLTMEETGR